MSITKNQAEQSMFLIVSDRNNNINKLIASPINFQVGLKQNPADLTVMGKTSSRGAICLSVREYRENALIDDDVSVALVYGGGQLTLPRINTPGHHLCVKDADGSASTTSIVLTSSAKNLIDGSVSTSISTNYGTKILCWYNNQWFVVSSS